MMRIVSVKFILEIKVAEKKDSNKLILIPTSDFVKSYTQIEN